MEALVSHLFLRSLLLMIHSPVSTLTSSSILAIFPLVGLVSRSASDGPSSASPTPLVWGAKCPWLETIDSRRANFLVLGLGRFTKPSLQADFLVVYQLASRHQSRMLRWPDKHAR